MADQNTQQFALEIVGFVVGLVPSAACVRPRLLRKLVSERGATS